MNMQQLKYVLEVYRQGSINKAAQTLFITQPALSIAIKELEKEIGFVIFERSNRGILPTPAGTAFIYTIRDVFLKLEDIKAKYITDDAQQIATVFRISSSRYSFVTDGLIEYFNEEISGLDHYTIMVEEQDCRQVIQDVLGKKADVGIIHTNLHTDAMQLKYFQKKDIKYVKLFESVPYAIFRKGHPLEQEAQISEETLTRYPQIRTSSNNVNYYDSNTNFSFLDYKSSGKNFFISSRATIYDLLSRTDAIFLGLTRYGINSLYPDFVTRPLSDVVSYFFYAVMLKDEMQNPKVKRFIEILERIILK